MKRGIVRDVGMRIMKNWIHVGYVGIEDEKGILTESLEEDLKNTNEISE